MQLPPSTLHTPTHGDVLEGFLMGSTPSRFAAYRFNINKALKSRLDGVLTQVLY
jgi:hypothetical protein